MANIFLNVLMALLVWLKIGSFVMITKQFGVYIRMIIMMMKVILNFFVICGAWILCSSLIFCSLFYQDNNNFRSISISFRSLLNACFNNFDINAFSNRTKVYGAITFEVYIAMSAIFLLNMIIAVLSNVY
jgi:hypothetical protein